MEMQQIRYFLALAQTLNFSRAAEACHVTQPALTRAIKALEAELGGDLIHRERGNSHLTPLGERMLPLLRQCHDAATSAQTLAKAVKCSAVAPLSLGLSGSVAMAALMGPIRALFQAVPGTQLKVRRGSGTAIGTMLKRGEIDLAIAGPLEEGWDRLDRWPIFVERMSIIAHRDHPLAKHNSIPPEQLAGERFLSLVGCETAPARSRYLAELGVEGVGSHEVETLHDMVALLEANAGIAVLGESAVDSPALCRPAVQGWRLERAVSVYGVAGRQRAPAANALLSLLRAADWDASGHRAPAVMH